MNAVTGRGRHTSSSAVRLSCRGGRLGHRHPGRPLVRAGPRRPDRVLGPSPTSTTGTGECPRGCTHDEPECALDAWVAAGTRDPERLASLRRLLRSRDVEDERGVVARDEDAAGEV